MDAYDCVIIGGGPAGLSASIYLARYDRSALVADEDNGGRWNTHEINENYLGFPDGIASKELRERGRRQAERFGVRFADARIETVTRNEGGFIARSGEGESYAGRALILATGVRDRLPRCEGQDLGEFFGKSLFWCITCDGYKARGRRVVIAGATDSAATTALQFLNFTRQVMVVTDREPGGDAFSPKKRGQLDDAGIDVVEGVIARLHGREGMLTRAEMKDGASVEMDVMFNQQGAEPNAAIARHLGVATDPRGYVIADAEQRTNVPMVFAAGDLTKEFAHQIVTAAHEGATAGQTANYELYRPEQRDE